MKRQLSLVLALVMILGSFSSVFAAVPATPDTKAEFLKEVKILKGNAEGELKLDVDLKRSEALVVLSRLIESEDEAAAYPTEDSPFEDIVDPFYAAFAAWGFANNYVVGKTETTFGPNDPLTTQHFATFLLRALGYEEDGADIFEKAYEEAKDLGILGELEVGKKDTIKRADMAEMTFNALNVIVKGSEETLANKLGIEMPVSEKLEVKVKADNLKEIKVELNNAKLVDLDQVEDARNYRTDAGTVLEAKLVDSTIVLTLETAMKQNRKYELTTRYIKGLDLDKEVFTSYDNEAPAVEKVTVLGTKGIRVRMTEPVTGAKEKDFLLNGKNFVMRVTHYGRDILLIPYREDVQFEEGKHELTVGSLEDYAGFKSKSELHEIEIVEDKTKPEVAKVIARNNSVIVEFVNEVHPDSVDKKNVAWTEVRGRKATEADSAVMLAGNKVEYKFNTNKELPKPAATIKISGLENYSGYKMDAYEAIHDIEVDFSRPEIVNFKFTAKNVMEIEFNKVLNEETAQDEDNYTLNEYKVADKDYKTTKYAIDTAELDGKVVTVTFRDGHLTEGNKYRLDVAGVRDNTTLKNTMIADELEFTYGIGEGLRVVAVRERTREKIVLEFNKDLVRREAEDLRNYEFELAGEVETRHFRASDLSKNPSVFLYGNGRTVEINLPGNGRVIDVVHLGTGLTALDGNRLDVIERVVDLNINYLVATKATLSRDGKLVTVEFNQDLKNQTINIAGITVGGATVASAKVVKGKLEITLTTAVDSITDVVIAASANIQGQYDPAAAVASVVAADIVNNRDLSVTVTANLAANNELTIDIVLNKAIDAKQEEDVDVLINNKFFRTLGKAVRINSTTYKFVVADKADAKTVRVVGLKLNETANVVSSEKVELDAVLEEAKAVKAEEYTAVSFAAFEAALTAAKAMPETTQAEVSAKLAAVNAAMDKLVKKSDVNKDALVAALATAEAKVEADYTAGSWTAFKDALATAIAMKDDTQEEVNAKVAAVNAAIAKLEVKPEEPSVKFEVERQESLTPGAIAVKVELLDEGVDYNNYTVKLEATEYWNETIVEFNEVSGYFLGDVVIIDFAVWDDLGGTAKTNAVKDATKVIKK